MQTKLAIVLEKGGAMFYTNSDKDLILRPDMLMVCNEVYGIRSWCRVSVAC